jgi:hypothetical protein
MNLVWTWVIPISLPIKYKSNTSWINAVVKILLVPPELIVYKIGILVERFKFENYLGIINKGCLGLEVSLSRRVF